MSDINKIAENYHSTEFKDKFIEDESQLYTLNWINSILKRGDSVLEMGYGEGIVTNFLSQLKIDLDVIEGAQLLIDKASLKHKNVNFIHSMFEDFIPTKKYNIIICTHVLEHVDNPIFLLSLMRKWIKDDGKIIIIVPNAESIHRRLSVIMGIQNKLNDLSQRDLIVGHQRVYDYNLLEDHIKKSNLKISVKKGFFLKTLPNSMMLNYDIKLIRSLNIISESIPFNLLANLAYVVKK